MAKTFITKEELLDADVALQSELDALATVVQGLDGGSSFSYVMPAAFTTTSSALVTAYSVTTPILPAAKYRVSFCVTIGNSNQNTNNTISTQFDGVTTRVNTVWRQVVTGLVETVTVEDFITTAVDAAHTLQVRVARTAGTLTVHNLTMSIRRCT